MAKRAFVGSLHKDDRVEDMFVVGSKSVGTTSRGDPFMRLRLCDRTGSIGAVRWDASESEINRVTEGEVIVVKGTVSTYKDSLQIDIQGIARCGEAVDPADFVMSSPRDLDEMLCEFDTILAEVTHPQLRALLDEFFSECEFRRRFREAPAAVSVHHAYVGGLLEHTLSVMQTCRVLAQRYAQVDLGLLLTGAALHDVGKVDELICCPALGYSDSGNLIGHVVGGTMMVRDAASRIEGFDPLLSLAVQHMILSHHGQAEWGSPKKPMSYEALLLHYSDDMDAKVFIFEQAIKEAGSEGQLFTGKHKNLDRAVFKGVPVADEQPARLFGDLFTVDED
jgi:3'-5' exoribonuclease